MRSLRSLLRPAGLALALLAISAIAAAPFARREPTVPRTLTIEAPSGDSVWFGDTATFTAVARDTRGRSVPRAAITWTVSDTASARLSGRVGALTGIMVIGVGESSALTLTATWRDSGGKLMAASARAITVPCARRGIAREVSPEGALTHVYGVGSLTDHYLTVGTVHPDTLRLRREEQQLLVRFCFPAQTKVAYHYPDGQIITDTVSRGYGGVKLGETRGRDLSRDRAL